jgi:hypothetical protein
LWSGECKGEEKAFFAKRVWLGRAKLRYEAKDRPIGILKKRIIYDRGADTPRDESSTAALVPKVARNLANR